jgi:hypothetical protein
MKKIIFSLLVIVVSLSVQAQVSSYSDNISTSSSRDTVNKVINASAGYSALGIQVNVAKTSGTISGKAFLSSSIDGVNYNLTDSSAAFTDQATNAVWFTKTTTPYSYYKVQVRESGLAASTQVSVVTIYWSLKKHY